MKKFKIFFGVACLVLAVGLAFGTKAMTVSAPEYYYNGAICTQVPVTTICQEVAQYNCIVDVDPTAAVLLKQIYDDKDPAVATRCLTPLFKTTQN